MIHAAFEGRYEQTALLGRGAYGVVVKTRCGRAIKWVRAGASTEDVYHDRELEALDYCRHPNVVSLIESTKYNGDLYLVLECWSTSLAFQLRRPAFTLDQGNWILMNVLRGLAHIHECGYIHRDLKPANILLNTDSVCIADFGHAVTYPPRSEVVTIQTDPEQSDKVFTRWYRPPEVTMVMPYDESADVFSVGCVYVEIVRKALGQIPYALFHESGASFPLSGTVSEERQHIENMFRVLGTPTKEELSKMSRSALYEFVDSLPDYERVEFGFPAMQTAWVYAMLAYDPSVRISAAKMLEWVEDA